MEKEVSHERKQNGTHSLCDAGIGNVVRFGMLTYARRVRDTESYYPPPKKFSFLDEVLNTAVKSKQVPDDAVVSGDTSKLWRIIFNGLGAKAGDALAFIYVSPSGDDSNEGSSWEKAKQTIGGALNGITDATDTKRYIVLIGAGAYSPSVSLSLKNYVALIGGFEASSDEETRYERRGITTISGEDTIRVFKNENLDTLSTPSKKSTAVLAGVTITKGKGKNGGGMFNNNSSPTVVHTTFSGNTASNRGGGMFNVSSSTIISSSIFWGNTKGSAPDQIDNDSSPDVDVVVAHSIVQKGSGTSIISEDPHLEALADNGGFVKTMALTNESSAINKGLYFAREGTTNYYSEDGSTWYTDPTLTEDETPNLPTKAVRDDTDARGYGHKDRPDIGAYEYGGTEP